MTDDATTRIRKTPAFTAYFISDRDGCPWVPIGAAWDHRDGDGFNLRLDLIPNVPGRIVLRRIRQDAAGEQASQQAAGDLS